jgi:hypothetical protein
MQCGVQLDGHTGYVAPSRALWNSGFDGRKYVQANRVAKCTHDNGSIRLKHVRVMREKQRDKSQVRQQIVLTLDFVLDVP